MNTTITKEKVIMDVEIITDSYIKIQGQSTNFCHISRIEFPSISSLEKEIKELRKVLKENKVTLGKTNTMKMLKENKKEYSRMVEEYNQNFDNLVSAWKEKMTEGIYCGYIDDQYLNNVITPLKRKIEECSYTTSLLDKVYEIKRKVDEIKSDFETGTDFMKVYI